MNFKREAVEAAAVSYAEDIIKSYEQCSDVTPEFLRGVEECAEEAFLACYCWLLKQSEQKGGEL